MQVTIMSTFENPHYRWRETYFVLFDEKKRPKTHALEKNIRSLNKRYEINNATSDENGMIESLTVISPDDYAAMDICYTADDEIREQAEELVSDLKKFAGDTGAEIPEKKILAATGRFDVLHFERIGGEVDEEEDDMLDPGTLLIVLEALAKLTKGVAIDPQSGAIIDNE
jgi:hypothetical protein